MNLLYLFKATSDKVSKIITNEDYTLFKSPPQSLSSNQEYG